MTVNPFRRLIESRKFWMTMLDAVISITILVVAAYYPDKQDLAKTFVAIIQPVFITLIGVITVENVQQIKAAGGGKG